MTYRFDACGGVFIGHIMNVGFMYKYLICVIIGFCCSTSTVFSTFLFALLWTSGGVIASVFRCMVLPFTLLTIILYGSTVKASTERVKKETLTTQLVQRSAINKTGRTVKKNPATEFSSCIMKYTGPLYVNSVLEQC
jgi:hypothetical protein